MEPDLDTHAAAAIATLRGLISSAERVVVFSGAGISTESGIPDFRSPGGVWSRYDPRDLTFDRYVEDPQVRMQSWQMRREFFDAAPQPNAAHRALAEAEQRGHCAGVITQNIDGLHQQAGSRAVVELHGTAREVACIGLSPPSGTPQGCGYRTDHVSIMQRLDAGESDPHCPDCGGIVKSATISFGQMMDARSIDAATDLARRADLLIAVGSSLQVFPAAGLPVETLRTGGALAIVNDEPTPLDDLAEVVVRARAAAALPAAFAR